MKKDNKDKELNELFDFENVEEKNIINKAKTKSYMRMIGTSLGMTALIIVLGIASKLQLMPFIVDNKIAEIESHNTLMGANTFIGPWDTQNKVFNSGATAVKYKLIENKPVYVGEVDVDKSDYENHLGIEGNDIYSYYGNRIMEFYHPLVKYDKYSNDLLKINEIDDNKNIEMGLSFDKSYTIDDIEDLLPKDVSINWLWVDTYKDDTLKSLKKFDNGITKRDAQILEEDQITGFSLIDKVGNIKKDPINEFIEDINYGLRKGGKYKDDIKYIHETLSHGEKEIEKNNIKIIGAVIVSDKEGLSKLKDLEMIKSSSFGVITDKY